MAAASNSRYATNQLSEFVRRKRTMKATAASPARNDTVNPIASTPGVASSSAAFRASSSVFAPAPRITGVARSEEHTSELQSRGHLVCRLLLEKKKNRNK